MAELPEDALMNASARQSELLLYDFFKHMTTLSLVTLGGILSISQTSGVEVPVGDLVPSLGLVTISGATSLYGMEEIIKLRLKRAPIGRIVRWYRLAVSGSFGLGVGAFLGVFANALG